MWKRTLATLLLSGAAHAAPYSVTCTAPCAAGDGTTQPAGTVLNVVAWDGHSAYVPSDAAGNSADVSLVGGAGTIYVPPPPALTAAQQAATLRAGGITITSTATPALNGTYGLDNTSLLNMAGATAAIAAGKGFPNGAATLTWYDASNAPHTFTSPTEALAFFAAAENAVAEITAFAEGTLTTAPSTAATIP